MDPRIVKKVREAERLRAFSPQETIRAGLRMSAFARRFREAADRA